MRPTRRFPDRWNAKWDLNIGLERDLPVGASDSAAVIWHNARMTVEALARNLSLGSLLTDLETTFGGYEVLDHWQRGEFHHDLVLRVDSRGRLPGTVLVVSTNCNGGVKEVFCFDVLPRESALWHLRCPRVPEFMGELPPVLAEARTIHWFDPCVLLTPDARSEYRPECRERQKGGGWRQKKAARTTAGC